MVAVVVRVGLRPGTPQACRVAAGNGGDVRAGCPYVGLGVSRPGAVPEGVAGCSSGACPQASGRQTVCGPLEPAGPAVADVEGLLAGPAVAG